MAFKGRGDGTAPVPFVAGAAYSAGDVVVLTSGMLGIVVNDVASGATGLAHTQGDFEVAATSASAILSGEKVVWDSSASAFEDSAFSPATGDVSSGAMAVSASGVGVTTVWIRLAQWFGTVA